MKKYLEFQDAKSYKFWQIEVTGNRHTVTYGKIGTEGTTKAKEFAGNEAAIKDAEKLINSKVKKGYKEKSNRSEKRVSQRFHIGVRGGNDGEGLVDIMKPFFATESPAAELTHLTIGCWEEAYDVSPDSVVDYLIEVKERMPRLKSIYFGDIGPEDCEISWINQTDYGPLLMAFPQLEELRIKGSQWLELSDVKHASLKRLEIVCGGLGKSVLADIANAELPALENLELYLGSKNYGFDGSIDDLKPFMEKGKFPKLTYLGLMNSGITDDIATAIAEAPVLDQLHTLDLSKGTITDKGAEALLNSEKIKQLNFLNLNHHYMSDEMMKRVKAIGIPVDMGNAEGPDYMDGDWDGRYPEITE